MPILFLDRRGVQLRIEASTITVRDPKGGLSARFPFSLVDSVVLSADASLSTSFLAALAAHRIPLIVLSRWNNEASALLGPWLLPHAARRLQQCRLALQPDWVQSWCCRLVQAKIRAQARRLSSFRDSGRLPEFEFRKALAAHQDALSRLAAPGLPPDVVMGIEGWSAAAWFSAFQSLFAPSLHFNGRNRRPPRDPVNACLSLGYTLLVHAATREVLRASLDPHLGFLHAPASGRPSLSCDLMEPLRPRVDAFVAGLFHQRLLRPEHFSHKDGACLLGKTGRQTFYEAWAAQADSASRKLRAFASLLLRLLSTGQTSEDDSSPSPFQEDHDD